MDAMVRTSDSDPIRVDFVDPKAHGLPGRLGLTIAPGKSGRGVYASWDRDLAKDLARLRDAYGTQVLVTLLESFEMERASIPKLRQSARRAGMRSLWFPIADVSTPHFPDDPIPLVRDIVGHLTAGDTVVVHCMGGLGRSGTIAACVLAARGLEPGRAVEVVRAARPGALETAAQVAFVGRFRNAWRDRSPTLPMARSARRVR
jgi:protein-tyrosine phosphatase